MVICGRSGGGGGGIASPTGAVLTDIVTTIAIMVRLVEKKKGW